MVKQTLTKPEMAKLVAKMRACFPSMNHDTNDIWTLRVGEYHEALKGFSYCDVESAVNSCIKDETFFPTVSNIVCKCRAIRDYERNTVSIDGMSFTKEEMAKIQKETAYRKLAEESMSKMTQEELKPYRDRAIKEIGFKGKITAAGEMGIFWHTRESIRKELMGEPKFTLRKGDLF